MSARTPSQVTAKTVTGTVTNKNQKLRKCWKGQRNGLRQENYKGPHVRIETGKKSTILVIRSISVSRARQRGNKMGGRVGVQLATGVWRETRAFFQTSAVMLGNLIYSRKFHKGNKKPFWARLPCGRKGVFPK